MCIEMLHVFQKVESIHGMHTFYGIPQHIQDIKSSIIAPILEATKKA